MKLRGKFLLSFLSVTSITIFAVGTGLFGFNKLNTTTDYLINVNSKVLQYASLFEKDLAQSRRAEKEFFIFPNNVPKQDNYVASWKKSMSALEGHLDVLESLFIQEQKKDFLDKTRQVREIISKNRDTWDIVVKKFKETKSYDTVNKAEYGEFKKRIHIIEDIGVEFSKYGYAEVEKGRKETEKIQYRTLISLLSISVIAILWATILAIIASRKMSTDIIHLSRIANNISRGKIGQKIQVERQDELGDLAQSIRIMQNSVRIMLRKFS